MVPARTPGNELKRRREAASLSQQVLAGKLAVSLPSVSAWERDKNVPRRQLAARIDKMLRADGALMAAFGYVTQPDDGQLTRLVAVVAELARRVDQLQAQVVRLGGVVVPASRRAARRDAQSNQGST